LAQKQNKYKKKESKIRKETWQSLVAACRTSSLKQNAKFQFAAQTQSTQFAV